MLKLKKQSIGYGFTLVELIVVIVILAILATIAFLSFSNQSSAARDSTRLSDISNIAKGLSLNQTIGGSYPIPDKYVKISSSASAQIGFQGEASAAILNIIKFSAGGGKDPLDKTYYTYSTNLTQNKYQLLTFLENSGYVAFDYNPFSAVEGAFSFDYTNRYPYEKGDDMGIVLAKSISTTGTNSGAVAYTPIQDITSLQSSSTGFVIEDATINTGMVAIQNNSISSVSVTIGNLAGFTSPVNPNGKTVVKKGSDITSSTDIYSLSDNEIKYLFESGSYYTQNWASNPCNTGSINVITVNNFSSAYSVPGNTIVKVPNGTYSLSGATTSSGHITFAGNCSAIIGQSRDGVLFNSNFTSGARVFMPLMSSNRSNTILYNFTIEGNKASANRYAYMISLNGSNNDIANAVVGNGDSAGITLSVCDNCMISGVQTYNNGSYGFDVSNSQYPFIYNITSYNNPTGVYIENSTQNAIINNCMVYNNSTFGLLLNNVRYSTISNCQIFNNSWGLILSTSTGNNYLKNLQVYGNDRGIVTTNGNNYMNNISTYNNNIGYFTSGASGNKYYGSMKMFGASQVSFSGTTGSDSSFSPGTDGMMGWPNGSLDITANPIDCSYHSQSNLVASWGAGCGDIGIKSSGLNMPVTSYNFGSNIFNQVQPLRCPFGKMCLAGSNLVNYGVSGIDFDPAKKIGQ